MRRIVFTGAMIIGAVAGLAGPSVAQYYPHPAPHGPPGGYPGGGWHNGGGWHGGGGWYNGASSHPVGHGGYVTNRPGDGLPPVYNRPNDGLPPLPAHRLPNGQYIVNRPGDGLPPFVVGRPRY